MPINGFALLERKLFLVSTLATLCTATVISAVRKRKSYLDAADGVNSFCCTTKSK